jgi:hypothetical protein
VRTPLVINLMQGMDKASAQSEFIKEAEEMGIPPPRWNRDIEPVRFEPPAYIPWPPPPPTLEIVAPPPVVPAPLVVAPVRRPVARITWCPVHRRLLPRARESDSAGAGLSSNVECKGDTSDKLSTLALLGGGLSMLSGMGLFLWMTLKKRLTAKTESPQGNVTEKSRVHARAWNMI